MPANADLRQLKKEDLRQLEGDQDKDEDSATTHGHGDDHPANMDDDAGAVGAVSSAAASASATTENERPSNETSVDLHSLRRVMRRLHAVHSAAFEPLNIAFHSLAITLTVDLRLHSTHDFIDEIVNVFVIIFEIVVVAPSEFIEFSLPAICNAASFLPVWAQARLAAIWGAHCRDSIKLLLETLQQLISLQVIAGSGGGGGGGSLLQHQQTYVQDNETIVWATKAMKVSLLFVIYSFAK